MTDDLMTTKQVAKRLNTDEETVRRRIRNRELEAYRMGRDYRISEKALQEFLNKQLVGADSNGN